jgi:hypothetical protein
MISQGSPQVLYLQLINVISWRLCDDWKSLRLFTMPGMRFDVLSALEEPGQDCKIMLLQIAPLQKQVNLRIIPRTDLEEQDGPLTIEILWRMEYIVLSLYINTLLIIEYEVLYGC